MSGEGPAIAGPPLEQVLAEWDALAVRWGLGDDERAALRGGAGAGPRGDPLMASATTEHRLRTLLALGPVLEAVHADGNRIREWLRRPNVQLGGDTPLGRMAASPEWIRWIVEAVGVAA